MVLMVEDKLKTKSPTRPTVPLATVMASTVHSHPFILLAETSQTDQSLLVALGPQKGLSSRQVFKEKRFH